MAKQKPFKLNDRVLSSKWIGQVFNIVMIKDNRYAIQNDQIRAIATKNELTLIEK